MSRPPPRLAAVLGPTNTGKTYLAVERMLAYPSGMMGFPLRLLARENYDRVVKLAGAGAAALVTGEERIVPPQARYFLCTVEAMPERTVDFLAVDEIQLAADPERGHVFTDRLLYARGREETMFVGSDTVRPLIKRLLPGIEIISRPRFSRLSYSGERKLARLPPRSAVVAFSVEDVYDLAEQVRRRRGGTAVVMGALSPRTRNAQVGLFQAGEVDYLVATDAIGMGLNMDLGHVAFARLTKFDGRGMRRLSRAELGQIAGRAGRHMRDGTFGTTADAGSLDEETVEAIEDHRFEALRYAWWRNPDLDFGSLGRLLRSLDAQPGVPELRRKRDADDHMALMAMARAPDIERLASSPAALRLLWQVAQVPDFRKTISEAHASLLARLFRHLAGPSGRLPDDWVAAQLARLDRADGDIDSLMQRIAHVRTWTYIAHREDWMADPRHWQERARTIEDKLSDALHDRLTERFVDRRAAALARRGEGVPLMAALAPDGRVLVEGESIGRVEGFRFTPEGEDDPAVLQLAVRAVRTGIETRVAALEAEDDSRFALLEDGRVTWGTAPVARLQPGREVLAPSLRLIGADLLDAALQTRVERRLHAWLSRHIAAALRPLAQLRDVALTGGARGIAFQLCEALGCLPRARLDGLIATLNKTERQALAAQGVRIGPATVHMVLPVPSRRLRATLWAVARGAALPPPLPAQHLVSLAPEPGCPEPYYAALGFVPAGARLVRADRLDKLARAAQQLAAQGAFAATPSLARLVGATGEDLSPMLAHLGFRREQDLTWRRPGPRRRPRRAARRGDPASPFAKLRDLVRGR